MTKPIIRLTELSRKMADLDFDVKYEGKSKDEIHVLGENMNYLAKIGRAHV